MPPPAAMPFTAMTTGFWPAASREIAPCRYVVSSLIRMPIRSGLSAKSLTSPPAQNALPAPVITMQRTARSSSASSAGVEQVAPERQVQGVVGVGPIERDGGDAVLHLVAQRLVGHGVSL